MHDLSTPPSTLPGNIARANFPHVQDLAEAVGTGQGLAEELEASRLRQERESSRLREAIESATSQRQEVEGELKVVRKDCADLRAHANAAEEEVKTQIRRGRAELAEVVRQKDEMVGRGRREGRREGV